MNKPVETEALTITGAEAVVEMLHAHGVEIVFGLCGNTGLPGRRRLPAAGRSEGVGVGGMSA